MSMIASGNEPATFRFVAQCLNQMLHRVPQPFYKPVFVFDWLILQAMHSVVRQGVILNVRPHYIYDTEILFKSNY